MKKEKVEHITFPRASLLYHRTIQFHSAEIEGILFDEQAYPLAKATTSRAPTRSGKDAFCS